MENVYQCNTAAMSYAEFAKYDPNLFREIVRKLKEAGLDSTKQNSILDIGVGSCDFAIPLVRELLNEGIDAVLYGFDNSKAMIDRGLGKLQDTDLIGRIWLCLHDMRNGLRGLPENRWNIISSIFSIHYAPGWQKLVNEIYQMLPQRGFWIVTEASGDIPILEAELEVVNDPDPMILEFWKMFHENRQAVSPWNPVLKTSYMGPVLSESESLFVRHTSLETIWNRNLCANDFLSWIRDGVIGAFGAGMEEAKRKNLAFEMEKWYLERYNSISKIVNVRFGVKTHIFQKI